MTISLWNPPFTDGIFTISAAFLNYLRTNLPKALDAVNGGIVTPAAPIDIRGTAGLIIGGSGAAARLQYSSRSVTRVVDSPLVNVDANSTRVVNIAIAASQQGQQRLHLPDGSTLTAVTTYHDRADTGVDPVAGRVFFQLFKFAIATGTPTQIGTTTLDPAASLVAYEGYHGFSISALVEVIDNANYVYYALFNGESGGAAAATTWYGCATTTTITSQDEAA